VLVDIELYFFIRLLFDIFSKFLGHLKLYLLQSPLFKVEIRVFLNLVNPGLNIIVPPSLKFVKLFFYLFPSLDGRIRNLDYDNPTQQIIQLVTLSPICNNLMPLRHRHKLQSIRNLEQFPLRKIALLEEWYVLYKIEQLSPFIYGSIF
jgi:hypothetical protein